MSEATAYPDLRQTRYEIDTSGRRQTCRLRVRPFGSKDVKHKVEPSGLNSRRATAQAAFFMRGSSSTVSSCLRFHGKSASTSVAELACGSRLITATRYR